MPHPVHKNLLNFFNKFLGFGDIVPSEQVYVFFTMAYILFGLSL